MSQLTLIQQLYDIAGSRTYDDAISNADTQAVAENAANLEYDLNINRTHFKLVKGTTHWYDNVPITLTDAKNQLDTINAVTRLRQVQLASISSGAANNVDVSSLNITSIASYTDENSAVVGILASTTKGDAANEGGKNRIEILNANGDQLDDGNGNTVFGYLVVDDLATPTSELVYFYSANGAGVETAYTFSTAEDIYIFIRERKIFSNMDEDYALNSVVFSNSPEEINIGGRTYTIDFVVTDKESSTSSIDALDIEASYVKACIGRAAGESTMAYTSAYNILTGDNINTGVSKLDAAIGNRNAYTEQNYVNNGDANTLNINALDIALKDVADIVADGIIIDNVSNTSMLTSGTKIYMKNGTTAPTAGNEVPLAAEKMLFIAHGKVWMEGDDYTITDAAAGEITITGVIVQNYIIIKFA